MRPAWPGRKGPIAGAVAILAALAAAVGVWLLSTRPGDDPRLPELAERVRVEAPARGEELTSPFAVRGSAPGGWFFEADFPVRLLDAEGEVVADTFARAEGEWMTESLVPFRATLAFDPPATEAGTLVLERANPSGLPENAAEVRIPVRFPPLATVTVFFPDSARDPAQLDCRRVYPVERRVIDRGERARAALEALLAGPGPAERGRGLLTSLPEGVTLREVTVRDGLAVADFGEKLAIDVAGSCRVLAIRAQIEETLLALPDVRRVVISVEGRTEEVLQP